MEYIHPETFEPFSCVQNFTEESMTVPNQALKIRDIMERSLRGQILPEVQMNSLQFGDDMPHDMADLDEFDDRTDVEEYANYIEKRIKEQKEAQERAKAEKAKQSEADEAKAENDEAKAEKEPNIA